MLDIIISLFLVRLNFEQLGSTKSKLQVIKQGNYFINSNLKKDIISLIGFSRSPLFSLNPRNLNKISQNLSSVLSP